MNRILAAVAALFVAGFLLFWFTGKKAEIKLAKPVAAIGTSTTISVETDDPVGVKAFSAAVEQNGQSQVVYENKPNTSQKMMIFTFSAGKKQAEFLKEGPAKLVIKAKTNDLRGATTTLTQDVQVELRPPTIVVDGKEHDINQGGMELVVLDPGGNWAEAGVHIANYTVGSFPMPGEKDNSAHRFSMFPFPWNVSADTIPVAYARSGAGMEVTTTFRTKVFPKSFRSSDINVSDANLTKVVGELDPDGQGSLVERFVKLNKDLRQTNTQQIYELRKKTENKILWSGPFIPMKGTRESFFADRRSYYYQGKKIDEQIHLGYDLAQTNNSPVKAANSGRVVWADRLGIYGNCVIIDHGYSLQSLYGHMSRLLVKEGDMVRKEQQIGISGATGMAFGDHVHFSMLIDGYQVDPKEWWDEHWIHDRILSKIGPEATGK
jgi:murein DD-endopeptidase MepM/ murein hydrolase activator NlpD